MRKELKAILSIGLALALGACSSDDTPQSIVDVNFTTVNTASSIPAGGRVAANTLEFTTGSITLREIQFETETDKTDSVEVNFETEVVIDFATGATTPDLSNLTFPAGTYTAARVELELQDNTTTPSVIINGTFTDREDVTHTIRFEFNSGETFEVEKEGSITIGAGASVVAEVTFDPSVWFAGVTSSMLESATKDNDGVIIISETSNPDIFDIAADGLDLAT